MIGSPSEQFLKGERMKKAILLLLVLAMLLPLVSCKKEKEPDRHFKDPTEGVTDGDGEGTTSPSSPLGDPENTTETPKVDFEDFMNSQK